MFFTLEGKDVSVVSMQRSNVAKRSVQSIIYCL